MNYKTDYEFDGIYVEFNVEFNCTEGEKAVMYDRDGNGYPGSLPSIDFESVEVTAVEIAGETLTGTQFNMMKSVLTDKVFERASKDEYLMDELYRAKGFHPIER